MSKWTLLTNHGAVLAHVAQHPQVTAAELSEELDITERSVRRIIADLVASEYLEKKKVGRVNHYRVHYRKPLRRPGHRMTDVGMLLRSLAHNVG